jgi:hypothetical protein
LAKGGGTDVRNERRSGVERVVNDEKEGGLEVIGIAVGTWKDSNL